MLREKIEHQRNQSRTDGLPDQSGGTKHATRPATPFGRR